MTPPEDKESRHIDVSLISLRCVLNLTLEALENKLDACLAVRNAVRHHDPERNPWTSIRDLVDRDLRASVTI